MVGSLGPGGGRIGRELHLLLLSMPLVAARSLRWAQCRRSSVPYVAPYPDLFGEARRTPDHNRSGLDALVRRRDHTARTSFPRFGRGKGGHTSRTFLSQKSSWQGVDVRVVFHAARPLGQRTCVHEGRRVGHKQNARSDCFGLSDMLEYALI